MKKRSYRKRNYKRKSFRRRRYRRTYRRGNKYDGAIAVRIHNTYDISHKTLYNHADLTVNWAGNGIALGPGNTARVTVCNELTTYV